MAKSLFHSVIYKNSLGHKYVVLHHYPQVLVVRHGISLRCNSLIISHSSYRLKNKNRIQPLFFFVMVENM